MSQNFTLLFAAACVLFFNLPAGLQAETRILFCSDKETPGSQRWELYTMSQDGSDLQRVTTTTRSEWAPALNPDNHSIAFIDNLNSGNGNLWLTDLDGAAATNVPITNRAMAVQWADDDTLYYLADISGGQLQRFQIWQVDTDGSNQQRVYNSIWDIFPTGSDSFQYHRSLDRLYFCARIPIGAPSVPYSGRPAGATFDIEFAPCDDPDFPPRGPELDDHYDVTVSPDGSTMAYAADFFDGSHRMYVRAATGDCSTQLRLSSGFTGDPDWSPDSLWIAFTQSTSSTFGSGPYIGNIYTAQKDGSTLVNLTGFLPAVSGRCAHPLIYEPDPALEPFNITSIALTAGGTVLGWQSTAGLGYQVEYSEDLITWLTDLPNSMIPAGQGESEVSYTDGTSAGAMKRYYRIRAARAQ